MSSTSRVVGGDDDDDADKSSGLLLPVEPPLYLYLLTNRKSDVQTTTQIGCVSDVDERMSIHNSKVPVPGSERRARQAAGYWKPLLVIVVPRASGLSARALAEQWKSRARKIHCRFQFGIENIAWHYKLPYFVNVDELRTDARITRIIPSFVRTILSAVVSSERATEDVLRGVANAVTSPHFQAANMQFNGLSFARVDRPRERYRKRKPGSATSRSAANSRRRNSRVAAAAAAAVENLDADDVDDDDDDDDDDGRRAAKILGASSSQPFTPADLDVLLGASLTAKRARVA